MEGSSLAEDLGMQGGREGLNALSEMTSRWDLASFYCPSSTLRRRIQENDWDYLCEGVARGEC